MNDDGYVHNNYSTFNCQSIQFIVTKCDEINIKKPTRLNP